jgi:hypothetical protein
MAEVLLSSKPPRALRERDIIPCPRSGIWSMVSSRASRRPADAPCRPAGEVGELERRWSAIKRLNADIAVLLISIAVLSLRLALLIGLPLVEAIVPIVPVRAVDEHRDKAALPPLSLLMSRDTGAFAAALNQWADDHAGSRDLRIRLKN